MPSKKPIIGIAISQADEARNYRWPMRWPFDYLGKAYHYAVEKSGGRPVGLFNTDNIDTIDGYLDMIDGILFSGGSDINPKYYRQFRHRKTVKTAEPRDFFELTLIKKALKYKKPIFCICRGHQVLNIALGGTLYQDLSLLSNTTLKHSDPRQTNQVSHYVKIEKGTILRDIIGKQKILCNSSHHQCIDLTGKGLRISSIAADGIVEGLELDAYPHLISVQWHPERIFHRFHSQRLFTAFVSWARKRG